MKILDAIQSTFKPTSDLWTKATDSKLTATMYKTAAVFAAILTVCLFPFAMLLSCSCSKSEQPKKVTPLPTPIQHTQIEVDPLKRVLTRVASQLPPPPLGTTPLEMIISSYNKLTPTVSLR